MARWRRQIAKVAGGEQVARSAAGDDVGHYPRAAATADPATENGARRSDPFIVTLAAAITVSTSDRAGTVPSQERVCLPEQHTSQAVKVS